MRLKSDIWVSAFLRTEQGRGAYVTVLQKGALDAGAIFIIQNHLNGEFSLFSPAPQSFFEEEDDGGRKFEHIVRHSHEGDVTEYLERQKKFDSDIWIIEVESKSDELNLEIAQ
ncbi:MAG: hypothetical protein COB78_08365 [Hyphomicrobiales bacterium]|nr:MAG: hypothetical protein COB78_08365 [Hyphomicrobiales bacterium]